MLLVDSNKRIKLHEIRQLPWFQKDLPSYLFAAPGPSSSAQSAEDDEPSSPTVDEPSAATWTDPTPATVSEGRRREWVDGLGVVDQEIVDDLCAKIEGLDEEKVWKSLKATASMTVEERKGDNEGNQVRIAYQLCRDNKRMVEGCLSSSPLFLGEWTAADPRGSQRTTRTRKRSSPSTPLPEWFVSDV